MIITLGGKPGTGKSVVAKLLAKKLKFKHYSNGDFMRQLAEEKGISLLELSKIAETDKAIDKELDKRQIELSKREDNFVIDSRLGFHFIPKAKKVFLDAKLEIRAKRIFLDKRRKEDNANLKKTIENIKIRESSETKRYKSYYNLDPYNPDNYDKVIDTSQLTIEQTADEIIDFVKSK